MPRLAAAAAVACLLAAAGCDSSTEPSTGPSTTPSAVAAPVSAVAPSAAATSAAPGTYRISGEPCASIDDKSLVALYGPAHKQDTAPAPPGNGGRTTVAVCDRRYGKSATGASIELAMANDGTSIESYYTGLRKANPDAASATEVPGLGQGAYAWTESTGPHLSVYDGNLYLNIAVLNSTGDPADAMIATARDTMAKLRRP